MNSNCPDCHPPSELITINTTAYELDYNGVEVELEDFYYKCPTCENEFDQEHIKL